MLSNTSSVAFDLSNLFIKKIAIPISANVMIYTIIVAPHFPFAKVEPAKVEEIIDGILAIVDININLNGSIGNNADI